MAERRMLAKSIVESDMFSDMPTDSQMLYVRLNMAADDDGFVDNPRTIMKAYGFSDDNMKLLISKKFVLTFQKGDNFIYLIKHWKVNNYIRNDRYHESKYKQMLRDVYYDENDAYSLSPDGNKPCLPSGNQVVDNRYTEYADTEDRLGKDSIEQFSVDQDSTGKGVQGENPPPIYSDPQKKIERIDYFIKRMEFTARQGWDNDCWFNLAEAAGIKRSEIELRMIQLQKREENNVKT